MADDQSELQQLVIRNLKILEAAPDIVYDVEKSVFLAINRLITNWYEEKSWDGVADYYGDEEEVTAFRPIEWPKKDDESKSYKAYKAYYIFDIVDGACEYHLSALTGNAPSQKSNQVEFGFKFIYEYKASPGQAKIWKEHLVEQFTKNSKLEQVGFKLNGKKDCLYLPIRIDSELLANSYPAVDEALAPINLALTSLDNAHPIIDQILKSSFLKLGK